ncbi:MAG: hypothetical protein CME31_10825 [Gimesia sp.]|uniref:Uncharacterized protein n=1 Tax=Gimesia maris TaxID=122 RepID=A0A3D3RGD1_9PLAN|nr:hypothetical protein [Gimesia sp.]HCO27087.1 hypothetical protein [Gimesia maris]|tara:strand:- start:48419 stop:48829 length:411 start_codon:yes stop_codon:yes gene_type:complete
MKNFRRLHILIANNRWRVAVIWGWITCIALALSLFKYSDGVFAFKVFMCFSAGVQAAIAFAGTITFLPLIFAPKEWLVSDPAGKIWLKRTGTSGKSQIIAFRIMTCLIGFAATFFFLASCAVIIGGILEFSKKSVI